MQHLGPVTPGLLDKQGLPVDKWVGDCVSTYHLQASYSLVLIIVNGVDKSTFAKLG